MLCSEFSIVKNDPDAAEAATLKCRRWSCNQCRLIRQAEVRALCRAGNPSLMVTLTAAPDPEKTPDQQAVELVRAWRLIVKRHARKFKSAKIAYLAVVEATKRGQPHLHILTREKFIDHAWLKEMMADITGSFVVWLTRLKSARGGAWYVSKYLGKDPHHYEGCKRYWTARDWIEDRAEWDEKHQKQPGMWARTMRGIHAIVDDFKRRGFHAEWQGLERVLFKFGTGYEVADDGNWAWTVTPEDRQRRQRFYGVER